MKRSRFFGICFVLPCLTLAGCLTLFPEPLSTEVDSFLDERFVGEWVDEGDDCDGGFTVVADSGENFLNFRERSWSEPESQKMKKRDPRRPHQQDTFPARASRLGNAEYLSVLIQDRPEDEIRWLILRYVFVSEDEVHLFWMDENILLQAVKNGQLTGILEKTSPGPLLRFLGARPRDYLSDITASRDELRKYLEVHADDCFEATPFLTLKRKVP